MRRSLILIILCFAVTVPVQDHGLAGEPEPVGCVQSFYQASADGNVEAMKDLITGPFYKRRYKLLEENRGYPDFLRDYFFRVNTGIVSTDVDGDAGKAVVVVLQTFQDGSQINTTLFLRKDSQGSWRIYDELLTD